MSARARAHTRILTYLMRDQAAGHLNMHHAQPVYASGAFSARARDCLANATPHAPISARGRTAAVQRQPRWQPLQDVLHDAQYTDDENMQEDRPIWRPEYISPAFQKHYVPLERARRRRAELGPEALCPVPLRLPPIGDWGMRRLRAPAPFPAVGAPIGMCDYTGQTRRDILPKEMFARKVQR